MISVICVDAVKRARLIDKTNPFKSPRNMKGKTESNMDLSKNVVSLKHIDYHNFPRKICKFDA
jgi:hypothetical protein